MSHVYRGQILNAYSKAIIKHPPFQGIKLAKIVVNCTNFGMTKCLKLMTFRLASASLDHMMVSCGEMTQTSTE